MNPHKSINPKNKNFQLIISGFNFSVGLLALSALKSGVKIGIRIPSKIEQKFEPELSNFYPMDVTNSLHSIANFNFFFKCSSLFPNHFFPQRVLSFNNNGSINKSLNITFDKLLKLDRESSSLPINLEKYQAYHKLSKAYSYGALVYEYRFDRNRAIIDLLKLCVEKGAIIVGNNSELEAQMLVNCNPIIRKSFSINIDNLKWPYPNSMRFVQSNFNITFQGIQNRTVVQFYLHTKEFSFDEFESSIYQIFNNLGLNLPEQFKLQLSEIFNYKKYQQNLNANEQYDVTLPLLRNETINLIKKISVGLGLKIDLNKTFQSFGGNEMKNEIFRIVQNECDQKFDLAKQTGIKYESFILLFYRYRMHIDNMIELAYDKMNKERNPEKIWNEVEADFLENELLNLR